MDSGNSGSMQSSSGGDEEYDSRAAAHSLFMATHSPSPSHLRPISTPPPPLFDPLSTYLQLHNPNALPLNPNTPWPRPATSMRSDPNPSNPIIFPSPAAALGETTDHLVAAQHQNTAARNPRKRSRASRRAPTTVLTTDTTNFRAMVQEFTGIPAPPFDSSPFSRNRLDLFTTRSTAFEPPFPPPPPPYLRRPFPQKAQSPPPFLASSTAGSVATSSTTPDNYQLPITQSSNLFNVQNQNSFSSLLQSNPRFLLSSSNVITSKTHDQDSFGIPTNDHIRVADFDDRFGLRHHENHHVSTALINGLPNLVSPDQIGAEKDQNHAKNVETGYHHQIKTTTTMTVSGGGNSFSPSGYRGGKGPENIAARGEGMVDSWICSSE